MGDVIRLQHGCGGRPTAKLIEEVFYKSFHNDVLLQGYDSAFLNLDGSMLAYTTDSFIVKPLFFPGGDIGKLAVCGTVNDLAVCGAKPLYLSCGMIIEEGFEIGKLKMIADSMAAVASSLGVRIVTGDTKVVERGNAEGIYINTSGIGIVMENYRPKRIKAGDAIIISGGIGEHGALIALNRFGLDFGMDLQSDCAAVFNIVEHIKEYFADIKLMKDPTRGGIATAINEMAKAASLGAGIYEGRLPIRASVKGICGMLGMEPIYLACEGRLLLVVEGSKAEELLQHLRQLHCCRQAEIIGFFNEACDKLVFMENEFGYRRIVPELEGDLLPRIC